MAITQNTYTGDGTTVLFTIAFPYLERDHVKASLNGTPTTAFTFANSNTIQFNVAPANGVAILLFRETESGALQNQFFPNSSIPSDSLNNNFTQGLYVAQETDNTSNQALSDAQNAVTTANGAVVTANAADAKSDQAIIDSAAAVVTANTAESNSLAAVSTANAASSAASAAVSTANAASSAASAAVITANAADATATQASIDAAAAVVTANAADGKADSAIITANAADAAAAAAVITANAADANASAAVITANTAESNSLAAISTANSAASAVAAAVFYQPIVDLAALALLAPTDGDFFELQDSTGAETDPSITNVPMGLVGAAGLTFRLRYNDPPGEYEFLGYFANDSETRYLKPDAIGVTVEPYDASILKSADIGVTVQGYDAGTLKSSDIGVTVQGYDAGTLKSSDIGITVQGYDADTAKLDVAQTFTAVQTLTDPAIIGTILEDVFTITDGAAFEVDPGNGSIQLITLGANRTPKATNFAAGEAVTLMVDDGSAYTLTWTDATWGGSGVVWKTNAGVAPTLNTTGYTVITLWKVGTQVYGARVGDA